MTHAIGACANRVLSEPIHGVRQRTLSAGSRDATPEGYGAGAVPKAACARATRRQAPRRRWPGGRL